MTLLRRICLQVSDRLSRFSGVQLSRTLSPLSLRYLSVISPLSLPGSPLSLRGSPLSLRYLSGSTRLLRPSRLSSSSQTCVYSPFVISSGARTGARRWAPSTNGSGPRLCSRAPACVQTLLTAAQVKPRARLVSPPAARLLVTDPRPPRERAPSCDGCRGDDDARSRDENV